MWPNEYYKIRKYIIQPLTSLMTVHVTSRMSKKWKYICHIMTGNGISVRNNKESLAALHIQRQHKIDKDNRCRRRKKMTRLRIVYCPRSSLTGVGWRRRLGQVVFGSAELRHPSCATLGTCILRCANFFFIFLILQKKTHFSQFEFSEKTVFDPSSFI